MKTTLTACTAALLLTACGSDSSSSSSTTIPEQQIEDPVIITQDDPVFVEDPVINNNNQSGTYFTFSGIGVTTSYDCAGSTITEMSIEGSLNDFTLQNCPIESLIITADNTTLTLINSPFNAFDYNSTGGNTIEAPQNLLDTIDDAYGIVEIPL